MTRKQFTAIMIVALLTPILNGGCAPPVLLAGAAAGAAVATDRRAPATVLEDQKIEFKAAGAIRADKALADNVHVSATSFNHVVLLTGQAPTAALRDQVVARVRKIDKVRRVHNEIEIAPPTSLKQRSRDTLITARVKSAILGAKGLPAVHVKVVTENDVVYMMGLIRRAEAKQIAKVAQQVDGVKRVVLAFEYTD